MIYILSLILLFSSISCHLLPKTARTPNQSPHSDTNTFSDENQSCAKPEKYPALFNILHSGKDYISIELNHFKSQFKLANAPYEFYVYHIENKIIDRSGRTESTVHEITKGEVTQEPQVLNFPVTFGGIYHVELSQNKKIFWKQKVFAYDKNENTLSSSEKESLARQYAPILEMSPDEIYYPSSLDYIFNKVEPDPLLENEPFRLTTFNTKVGQSVQNRLLGHLMSRFTNKIGFEVKFPFSDIDVVLPFYGHAESVLKSGLKDPLSTRLKDRTSKNHTTIYYSVFENKHWNEIYINYHMFYAFDSKNGSVDKTVFGAHILDRESLTITLRRSTRRPIHVFFGAHLPHQLMAQLDSRKKIIQSWKTGRVFVNWHTVDLENNRLKAVAAKGSHGVYPIKGLYAVMANQNLPLLLEPAGGGPKLHPEFDTKGVDLKTDLKYKLKSLNISQISSACDSNNRLLVFSGSTVDVLGPTNATFPPFTDRESDYKNYADPNAPYFDMIKARQAK